MIKKSSLNILVGFVISSAILGCQSPNTTSIDIEKIMTSDYKQGILKKSEKSTDWAIDGRGFFSVKDKNSGKIYYTRKGSFNINKDGNLATEEGYILEPEVVLSLNQSFFYISEDGKVFIKEQNSDIPVNIAQINLTYFSKPEKLKVLDNNSNLYEADTDSTDKLVSPPAQSGLGKVIGKALEDLNSEKKLPSDKGCKVPDKSKWVETSSRVDYVIDGEGFFRLMNPLTGEHYYTRYGSFKVDEEGRLINEQGYFLEPFIQLSGMQDISHIDEKGKVWVKNLGVDEPVESVYELTIAKFPNSDKLKPFGFSSSSLYKVDYSDKPVLAKPGENGTGTLKKGFLEKCTEDLIARPAENTWKYFK